MSHPAESFINNPDSLWAFICEQLQGEIPRQSFLTWFKPLRAADYKNGTLTVCVPSKFYYDWIEGHYGGQLRTILGRILNDFEDIKYIVDVNGHKKPQAISVIERNFVSSVRVSPGKEFDTRLNSRYRFDNFIEGDCNRFARAAAYALAASPGQTSYNPMMVYGGPGLGKTHLMQAIGNHIVENNLSRKVLYVTANQFTADFVEAIKSGKSESFSKLYRSVDVLLLDDVHFFMTKDKTQEEFFHTFNSLHHSGKQLVFSSDRSPRELDGFDERLVSRLQWGLVTELTAPEYETRLAILKARSEEENVVLEDNIIQYLALNISDNIRSLQGAFIHILAQSSLLGQNITIDSVKQILKNFTNRPLKPVSVERIQELTARELGLSGDLIRAKTRKKDIAEARQIAMFLCTEFTKLTLKAIGLHFGGRDHATVIHARETINQRLKDNKELLNLIERLRRQIELSST